MTPETTENLFSIRQKNILITGGTAGIGLGIAGHFVRHGARVVICGRRANGAEIASGIGADFVRLDVSDTASITKGVRRAADLLEHGIDVLILNAGVDLHTGTVDKLDLDAFRRLYDINLFGLIQCLRDAVPYLQRGSSVIMTSSPAGCTAAAGMSAYGSSKAAVNHLTRTFAAELAGMGIRVNAILPGIVESEMSGSTGSLEFLRTLTMTGKVRMPVELAGTFQFLASAASEPVTGAIIAADDGISAGVSQTVMDCIAAQLQEGD